MALIDSECGISDCNDQSGERKGKEKFNCQRSFFRLIRMRRMRWNGMGVDLRAEASHAGVQCSSSAVRRTFSAGVVPFLSFRWAQLRLNSSGVHIRAQPSCLLYHVWPFHTRCASHTQSILMKI